MNVTILLRDTRGASAGEFALVLPLLLIFLFGIVDAGRFMWEYNRAEKATQMGVRYAVVTEMVPSGLEEYSFAINDGILAGEPVPTANFTSVTCTHTSCTCSGGTVCGSIGYDGQAFNAIVQRMQAMYPPIMPENVQIEYRNIGLGFSGDPNGPDVVPLITVWLQNLTFQPITCLVFACSMTMPGFSAALTGEDLSGTQSN